jgi:diguanylate cyclase (GGDEF)-like protein/PAS domain S-box-containing protein
MTETDPPLRVLLVDDDEEEFILLEAMLSTSQPGASYPELALEWVSRYEEAAAAFSGGQYDAYLIDYRLGHRSGLDLLREAAERGCQAPIIMLTGQGNYDVDLAAMQLGAADYLVKGQLNLPLLERSIRYAIERKQVQNELERLVQERTQALAQTNTDLVAEMARRRQAEAVLRESEIKFRALAETTSAAIFILNGLSITYANPAVFFVTGYRPEELLGKAFTGLIHPAYQRVFEQRGGMMQWVSGLPARFELKIIKQQGEERWVDVTSGRIELDGQEAWVVTAFDITERDQAEQALRLAKDHLEAEVAERTARLQKYNRELDALHKATTSLLSTLELNLLMGQILDSALEAIPVAERSWLHLIAKHDRWKNQAFEFSSGDPRIRAINLSTLRNGPMKAVFAGESIRIDDLLKESGLLGLFKDEKEPRAIRSAMIAPLAIGGDVFGTLSLGAPHPAVFGEDELRLVTSFAATATAAIHNAMLHREVKELATMDPLTGHLNRRALFDVGQREMERSHRFGHTLSAIMFDVDYFKRINDLHGHAIGDQVLCAAIERCSSVVRQVDILGRYGGDEFVVLLPETDRSMASRIADRIRGAITENPVATDTGPVSVTISMGIAQRRNGSSDLAILLNQADQALMQAKKSGRNRIKAADEAAEPESADGNEDQLNL